MSLPAGSRIFVAGHRGMVGSAIVRRLTAMGRHHVTSAPRAALDLSSRPAVQEFLTQQRIDCVVLAAARVGGIAANARCPVDFLLENLLIEASVIQAAHAAGVPRLLFLGSSCIYPRLAEQPLREEALLGGPLEPTNEPYAIAKIAGIKLCESYNRQYGRDYRSVMPTNLYGPGDNFHAEDAHVVPALMRRCHEAAQRGDDEVVVWGSGAALREFMHVDDMASACVHVLELDADAWRSQTQPMRSHLNVGSGHECTIRQLAESIAAVTGFAGRLRFDTSRPDGAPRKRLDTSRLAALGWQASIGLEQGLRDTYAWYAAHEGEVRR